MHLVPKIDKLKSTAVRATSKRNHGGNVPAGAALRQQIPVGREQGNARQRAAVVIMRRRSGVGK